MLASWAELSALADDDGAVMHGHILESLRDSQLFADTSGSPDDRDSTNPSSSAAILSETWSILERRRHLLGDSWPLLLSESTLTRRADRRTLDRVAAYAAILLIEAASSRWYPSLSIAAGDKIRTWFEFIVAASVSRLLGGVTSRFGAPFPSDWPATFPERVKHLAAIFEIEARDADIQKYASPDQQDDSLDVLGRWKLTDEEEGCPYFLFQCATGENWKTHKPGQPSMDLWRAYISWNGPSYKALAIPFTLRERGELADVSIRHQSAFVFDRLRIAYGKPDDGIDEAIRVSLVEWCKTKFDILKGDEISAKTDSGAGGVTRKKPKAHGK